MTGNGTNVSSWNQLLGGQTAKLKSTEELKCDLNHEMLGKHFSLQNLHYQVSDCIRIIELFVISL